MSLLAPDRAWWELSQMTHGEYLGIALCQRLGLRAQAQEEAQHATYMRHYMQVRYGGEIAPCAPSLMALAEVLSAAPPREARVGLQVCFEGVFFDVLTRWIFETPDPLLRATLTHIRRDEARHHRDGRHYAQTVQGQLDSGWMQAIWDRVRALGSEAVLDAAPRESAPHEGAYAAPGIEEQGAWRHERTTPA